MLKQQILEDLKKVVSDLGYESTDIVLSIPKNSFFGDYTTNLALQLAKLKLDNNKQSSIEIANKIVEKMKYFGFAQDNFDEIKIAGEGFINFFIKDKELLKNAFDLDLLQKEEHTRKILVEY